MKRAHESGSALRVTTLVLVLASTDARAAESTSPLVIVGAPLFAQWFGAGIEVAPLPTNHRGIVQVPLDVADELLVLRDVDDMSVRPLGNGSFAIDPGPLVEGETLHLVATCGDSFGTSELARVVGNETDDAPPGFADVDPALSTATASFGATTVTLQVRVDDTESPTIAIRVDGDEGMTGLVALDVRASAEHTVALEIPSGPARSPCFRLVAIDWAGNEGAHPDTFCVDVPDTVLPSASCASAPAAPLAPLLLALLVRSRKDRRARVTHA